MAEPEDQRTVAGDAGKGAGGGGAGTGGEVRLAPDARVEDDGGRLGYRHTPGNPEAEEVGEFGDGDAESAEDGPGNRYGVG
ncbi:MAG: hypothetical protein QOJ59_4003 [Thermomicrobiales bacterium]|jgi:hypothetical protein|nr:hypothetical protein [Thermomicrobiales bacterium]MEA2523742.1 hypothetical protein [Thermomicrobiales bacterium]